MIILGIESSCDDTAAAIIKNGKEILSSIVSSQENIHHKYGGVVPEIASRMHVKAIDVIVNKAINKAKITIEKIDGVAVTRGPGLIGSLLVGFSFAKAFAWARKIPWVGVNHLEGHIYSVLLNNNPPKFPFISLLASGGHTNLYYVTSYNDFHILGQTRDDAAGESFDKVAKMLGMGYPGGAVIEKLAAKGDPCLIKFPRPLCNKNSKDSFDFSFSGLKSAVARYIQKNKNFINEQKADIAAGFQEAVLDILSLKLINAGKLKNCIDIAVTGGVAINSALAEKIKKNILNSKLKFHVPFKKLCGDNAAMIGARGYKLLEKGKLSKLKHDVFSRNRL